MGREKTRIYVVDHNLGRKFKDEYGKSLDDLVKALHIKGYSVKAELFPDSLSGNYDIIILHPLMKDYKICTDFCKNHQEIPTIFCSNVSIEHSKDSLKKTTKEYLRYHKDEIDRTYGFGRIEIKPFLKFIKYLTGKLSQPNTNI